MCFTEQCTRCAKAVGVQVVDRNVLNACLEQAAAAARSQGLPVGTPASIQVQELIPRFYVSECCA